MVKANLKKFQLCLAAIAEALGGELTDEKVLLYFEALSDLTIQQVESATKRAIRELKFFPKPSELRDLVGDNSHNSRIESAWLELVSFCESERDPYDSTIVVDDPALAATIKSFGGPLAIWKDRSFAKYNRQKFREVYETHLASGTSKTRQFEIGDFPKSRSRRLTCDYCEISPAIEHKTSEVALITDLVNQKRI